MCRQKILTGGIMEVLPGDVVLAEMPRNVYQ